MTEKEHYWQFPIALLQLGIPLEQVTQQQANVRASEIKIWCRQEMTSHQIRMLSECQDEDWKMTRFEEEAYNFHGASELYNREDSNHIRSLAHSLAELKLGIPPREHTQWEMTPKLSVNSGLYKVNKDVGKKFTRVRADIFSLLAIGELKWKDFAYLAAVCAICFDKRKVASRATREQIHAMALGYGSRKQFDFAAVDDADSLWWPFHTIGRRIARLEKRGWFVTGSPDGRNKYYSNQISAREMLEYVAQVRIGQVKRRRNSTEKTQGEKLMEVKVMTIQRLLNDKTHRKEDVAAALGITTTRLENIWRVIQDDSKLRVNNGPNACQQMAEKLVQWVALERKRPKKGGEFR